MNVSDLPWSITYNSCSGTTSLTQTYLTQTCSQTQANTLTSIFNAYKDIGYNSAVRDYIFSVYNGIEVKYNDEKKQFSLPDGSILSFDKTGNYIIDDSNATVVYKSNRMREFSPYLNSSDMLAKFVEYLQTLNLKKQEVLELPIRLFIAWLVIEAAKRDNDNIPEDIVPIEKDKLISVIRKPRCSFCGRFVKRIQHTKKLVFCSYEHGIRFLEKRELCDIGVVAT